MQKIICILALTLLATSPVLARLGETEDQCVARYGPVVKRDVSPNMDSPMLVFMKNGYVVAVMMLDGKVGMELIKKQEDAADFSDNEIDGFLAADSANQKWAKSDAISMSTVWMREDGAQAQHDPFQHTIAIISKEYMAAEDAVKKKAEDKNLQGM